MAGIGDEGRFGMTEATVTVKEARGILKVTSSDTIYSLIRSGAIRAFKTGKGGKTSKWVIFRDSLDAHIRKSTRQALQDEEVL